MKLNAKQSALILLLPLVIAAQSKPEIARRLIVKPGRLGEDGSIFLSDFTNAAQAKGLALLKAGKQTEAAEIFKADMPSDTLGIDAVGLAQATPPAQWPAQIKALDGQLNRKQNDVRLAYRLGLLMYYDSISQTNGQFMKDTREFDEATALLTDLWKRTHDPFAGLTLTEMAFRFHTNDALRKRPVLETLIGVIGGKEVLNAYAQAKRANFVGAPPDTALVPEAKRYALAGVLCGLWSEAKTTSGTMAVFDKNGKPIPADKQVWKRTPASPLQTQEAAFLDRWIQNLHPGLGKKEAVVHDNSLP